MVTMDELIEKVHDIARREHRAAEEVLADMVDRYEPPMLSGTIESDPRYEAAFRELRPKLYRIARRYWQKVGDTERLALTDEELNEQFWLIDPEGIPRLKSEQGTIEIPPDPLEGLIGILDTDETDLSTTVRETLAAYTHPKYGWTKRGRTD